ncbi:MAG: ATP-binding protein [Candidatus Binataceae bacterium]
MALLIVAIIIFALVQRRRYRHQYRLNKRDKWSRRWERWQAGEEQTGYAGDCKADKWTRQWQEWDRWAHDAGHRAADIENKIASKLERAEAKLRREAERLRRHAGGAPGSSAAAGSANTAETARQAPPDEAQQAREARLRSEAQRKAYERARRRAAQEAGFYVHLMWYGIIIGACLILNLIVSPSFAWWIFPALGWGIGLVSHFGAVYGWRWIHERVFEPAIQREVQREVTIEKEVLRGEKQASLDELTATFAHEIRNPIAAAKSLVQQMGEDPTSNENVEYAKVALDELARVERSVAHLLKYAKEEDYSFDNVNMAAVLDNALVQMRGKLEARQINVSRNYIGGPTIRADADRLRQVFTNVIDNAIDAMETNTGERRLELAIRSLYPGTATVVIRDNGGGIAAGELAKIFNPFYTTKQNGTGLGMGIAKKVMDAHRGRIEMQSKVGIGTEFSLSIPLADATRTWAKSEFNDAAPGTSPPNSVTPDQSRDPSGLRATGGDGNATSALRASGGERQ